VAVADTAHIVRKDGVMAHGKAHAFVGKGIAVAPLLQDIAPMTAFEVVERWSRRLPAAQALQVLRWACSEELIVSDPADAGQGDDIRDRAGFRDTALAVLAHVALVGLS
jgi:hypothetical protein